MEALNKSFIKTDPPKSGNSDYSKYNFIVMKRGPKAPKEHEGPPSLPHKLEGGAQNTPNFWFIHNIISVGSSKFTT